MESQTLEVKCLHLEGTPSSSAHIPWTKTGHVATSNLKGQVSVPRNQDVRAGGCGNAHYSGIPGFLQRERRAVPGACLLTSL